jgi:hypothetical protein
MPGGCIVAHGLNHAAIQAQGAPNMMFSSEGLRSRGALLPTSIDDRGRRKARAATSVAEALALIGIAALVFFATWLTVPQLFGGEVSFPVHPLCACVLNAFVCRRLSSRLPSLQAGRCRAKLCLRTLQSSRAAQCPFSLHLTRLLDRNRRRQRSSSNRRSLRSRGSRAWFRGHSQERTNSLSTASPGTNSAPVRLLACLLAHL